MRKQILGLQALLCLICVKVQAVAPTQHELDTLAANLSVHYELISAKPKSCPAPHQAQCYLSRLTLQAPFNVNRTDWAIYFSQLMPIYLSEVGELTISHLNGDLHQLSPTAAFGGLTANTPLSIEFYTQASQITRSEFLPNYILASEGLQSRVIASTKVKQDPETLLETQPYLAPFLTVEQLHTSQDDATPWMGSQYLYDHYQRPILSEAPLSLIPKPQQLTRLKQPKVNLAQGLQFKGNPTILAQLSAAIDRLERLGISQNAQGIPVVISLDLGTQANEAYQLTLESSQVTIRANATNGVFYALQSIAGLVSLDNLVVPALTMNDAPRYAFRGMHIDVARNFRSKQFILDTLEQMAAYKLNKLHLHLADDEGWRLAINGLPELTDVGATRCFDVTEQQCLLPQLGAGLDQDASINGFYSADDYIEILRAAQAHFIEVIPSLDMPGHSRAAMIAMEARFSRLQAQGKAKEAAEYRLVEPSDTTKYSSIQHYNDNTLNVCIDSTYHFINKVLDEVKVLHQQAGVAFKTYHIGADETAGAWVNSPSCAALKKQHPELHSFNGYFIEKVSAMVAKKGLKVAGWSDGMSDVNVSNMPTHVQSNAWATLSENGHSVAHQHANQGWDVVLSSPDVTYFDFPYQSHPQEPGNHWASRAVDSQKVFDFMPDNLPAHAEIWQSVKAHDYSADDRQSVRKKPFYGIQGHLWSELMRSDSQAEYMMYPRLLALAERAWHQAPWELAYNQQGAVYNSKSGQFTPKMQQQRAADWQRFAALVGFKELAKLSHAGRFYRLPSVAARIENSKLNAFTPYPGIAIEYQDEDGRWHIYDSAEPPTSAENVRAVAPIGQRKGRALVVE